VSPKHGFDEPPQRLLVMSHIDEIGLIVTHIDDEGYLWFRGVGGWDAQILVGQRVVLDTNDGPVTGVVGKKPIHLLREEDRNKVADIRDMHIDIGARDGAQARERVGIGDVAVIDAQPAELPNGRFTSRALDNRLGAYVTLEAARLVSEAGGAAWELAAVAAAQEEITFGGSRTSAFALEPDAAIVVDVTHATDAPGVDVKEAGKHELVAPTVFGQGPRVRVHSAEYLGFLADAWDAWSALGDAGPEMIANIHPVRNAATYPTHIVGRLGWHTADTGCPIGPGTWAAACAATDVATTAATRGSAVLWAMMN